MRLTQPLWPRGLSTKVVLTFATLGPVGRKLPAPGTWGSLAGLLFYTVFFARAGVIATILGSALAGWLAVGLCGEAEIRMGRKDPGEVILDEVVAMPLCFLGWATLEVRWPAWAVLLGGFALFRFFDILKPLGIARLQALPGGWGVVIDDTAAALAACGALHAIACFWHLR
jgi:phosphatidylglycerophosphatase A